jgi:hypothetical protein
MLTEPCEGSTTVEADLAALAAAIYMSENSVNGVPAATASSSWKLEGRRSLLRNE